MGNLQGFGSVEVSTWDSVSSIIIFSVPKLFSHLWILDRGQSSEGLQAHLAAEAQRDGGHRVEVHHWRLLLVLLGASLGTSILTYGGFHKWGHPQNGWFIDVYSGKSY